MVWTRLSNLLIRLGTRHLGKRLADLKANPEAPENAAVLRPLVEFAREQSWLYHEAAARLFTAIDTDGQPQVLLDCSDRATVRWLWQTLLRDRVKPDARPLVIDLGAHDGLIGSMSLNLVQLGWHAILVEPVPEILAVARSNLQRYQRDNQHLVFIEAAIAEADGEVLFETGIGRDLARMEGHVVDRATPTTRALPAICATSLLARPDVKAVIAGAGPLVLSIDIEGLDFVVAKALLESGLRPDIIIFEVLRVDESELQLFADYGYAQRAHIGWNHIYVKT